MEFRAELNDERLTRLRRRFISGKVNLQIRIYKGTHNMYVNEEVGGRDRHQAETRQALHSFIQPVAQFSLLNIRRYVRSYVNLSMYSSQGAKLLNSSSGGS